MKENNKDIDMNKTFRQGLGGGILGACVGAPGLGIVLGMAHANKDKINNFVKKADKKLMPQFNYLCKI